MNLKVAGINKPSFISSLVIQLQGLSSFQLGVLTVYKPADIIRVSELSGVVEGGEARLTCDAEGYPQPKIYWTREEKGHFITLRDRHSAKSREGEIFDRFTFCLIIYATRVTGKSLSSRRNIKI